MKLLHLFSNHKVTGPAEPAIRLAAHLARRGHEVLFAHPTPREPGTGQVDSVAAAQGLTSTAEFNLHKHFRPLAIWEDARRLARVVDEHAFDIIHTNLVNDHLTAALAVARSNHKPKIIRTNHNAVVMPKTLRNRYLFPRRADALIELSNAALAGDVRRFRIPPGRGHVVDTAIDLGRFDPARDLPDMREHWGLGKGDFVVGIAARIQRHRRFGVLLDAVALARRTLPALRLVIIGRGTHKESVAVLPAHERRLDDITFFPGYLRGDEYAGALLALDVKVFLVPGTDGSCRAAREAMALGRPVLAARRGMLPELVTDGTDGLVVDDTPEDLADAMIRLASDPGLRRRMGEAARRTALERFDPAHQAARVERIYESLLAAV